MLRRISPAYHPADRILASASRRRGYVHPPIEARLGDLSTLASRLDRSWDNTHIASAAALGVGDPDLDQRALSIAAT